MKKVISILLTCTLLLTALVLPSSAVDAAEEGGFQGFESFSSTLSDPFSLVDSTTESANVHSGSKALKVAYTGGTNAVNLSTATGYNYTPGEWYKVSVWVKPESIQGGNVRVNLCEHSVENIWSGTKVDHIFLTMTASTANEWQEYTFTFQAQYAYYGLWIDSGDGKGTGTFYLDDLKISPCYSLSAASENTEQGTAVVSEAKAAKGDSVTFTATPAADCSFIGWYDANGVLVSNQAVHVATVDGDLALTAKFFSGVVQGFESFSSTLSDPFSLVDSTTESANVHSGSKALKVAYTSGTKAVNLSKATGYNYTAGEWYKVSVWVKPESIQGGNVRVNLCEHSVENIWSGTKIDHIFLTMTASTANEWQEYTFTFQAQYTYYGLWIDSGDGKGNGTFYLDDLKIEKVSAESIRQDEIENAFTFNGTAIRAADTTVQQALRFKTTVNNRILDTNALSGGVTVIEYGFVVLNKSLLNGAELTLESTYEKDGVSQNAPQKPAYKPAEDIDVVFEQKGDLKTFTAALTGITKDRYSTEYAVRVYVKLSNGEVHYAGETQYMSVLQCAALAFDAAGETYSDTEGNSWNETYETRSYLFENILKGQTVGEKIYNTAPLQAQ